MASSSPFRDSCLAGRVALVTGGGSGICFEISRQFVRHGCSAVVICGRRRAFLQRAVQMLQQDCGENQAIDYHVCDVRNPENCAQVLEYVRCTFGRLDILCNGAAGNFLAQARDLTSKGFATVMGIDAMGTFNMSRAAYQLLAEQKTDAVIINISATLQYGATHWQAHASAAKAAVDSLTRSLALEWGQDGIRVVGIAPGPIAETPGTTKLAPGLSKEDVTSLVASGIPLRRMGEASEIGEAAVYLCTAKYLTGDTVVVDGGQWLYREPMVPQEMVSELSRKVEAKSRAQIPRARL